MIFIQQQHWAVCHHHQRGFPGWDVWEVGCRLKRPWLQPLHYTGFENVTLITALIPFTMLSSPHRHRRTHNMRTHRHTYKYIKGTIVSELLSSAVSHGLPVVKSLVSLVLSSCQNFWLREELCFWPDNFGLKTLDFNTECVCVFVCATWDLVLC